MRRLPDINIDLDGIKYTGDLNEDLMIDRTNLDEEFETHSSKSAYYSTLHELAKHKLAHMKNKLEVLEANIDAEKRGVAMEAMTTNAKLKYTENMYKNEVHTDERYQELKKKTIDLEYQVGLLGVAREAFMYQRKSMLEQCGENSRYGNSDPKMKVDHFKKKLKYTGEE